MNKYEQCKHRFLFGKLRRFDWPMRFDIPIDNSLLIKRQFDCVFNNTLKSTERVATGN